MNWQQGKAEYYRKRHTAAMEMGDDKEAERAKIEYENYDELAKQVK